MMWWLMLMTEKWKPLACVDGIQMGGPRCSGAAALTFMNSQLSCHVGNGHITTL